MSNQPFLLPGYPTTAFVLGIGTGRCGTKSLAELLNGCIGATVHHELDSQTKTLSWDFDRILADEKLKRLSTLGGCLVGDVASYYLHYVDYFIRHVPDMRIVHVFRDKDLVIESFARKTGRRNHWMSTDQTAVADPRWDKCFPKYDDAFSKADAIARYYDEYLKEVASLKLRHAQSILEIKVDYLNDSAMQDALFEFVNVPPVNRRFRAVYENRLPETAGLGAYAREWADLDAVLSAAIPSGSTVAVVDLADPTMIGAARFEVRPFLERHGEYWGRPPNDDSAIDELERMRAEGTGYICFSQVGSWWLNYYSGLRDYLNGNFVETLRNDDAIIFDLR